MDTLAMGNSFHCFPTYRVMLPAARKTWIGTLNHLRGIDMDIHEGTGDENAIRALICSLPGPEVDAYNPSGLGQVRGRLPA